MKSLLYIAVIIIATIAGKSAFGAAGGIAGFLISFVFGIFMMRAQIIFFIGQNKYIKNHQSGIKRWFCILTNIFLQAFLLPVLGRLFSTI